MFWTYAHNFRLDDADLTERLSVRILEGFEQDRTFIEAQQAVVVASSDDKMACIFVDAGLAPGRRVLDRVLAGEAPRETVPV